MRRAVFLTAACWLALLSGCRSDWERVMDISKGFFQNLPDSAALAGHALPVEQLLEPPAPAVLAEKRAFFEKTLAELNAIDPERLEGRPRLIHQLTLKKTEHLLARLDGDLSLFDPLPVLKKNWERQRPPAARRAEMAILLKKLPAYFAAAKLNFTQKKGKNASAAVAEGVEAFRLLSDLKKDFPKNGDLDAAILAVKDWVAFCR